MHRSWPARSTKCVLPPATPANARATVGDIPCARRSTFHSLGAPDLKIHGTGKLEPTLEKLAAPRRDFKPVEMVQLRQDRLLADGDTLARRGSRHKRETHEVTR